MWTRKYLIYSSEASVQVGDLTYSTTRRLFFLSYWAIRWIHGKKKLWEMSAHAYFEKELGVRLWSR